nr:MAG TPA: hypothetical protein [Caudoviricetes sp.]
MVFFVAFCHPYVRAVFFKHIHRFFSFFVYPKANPAKMNISICKTYQS